jgi:putative SOS response-associated peptidase YedK
MINARAESVAEKPAFRQAFSRRRCLVPADGFFEWKADPVKGKKKGTKVPHWIHREDRRAFGMAGLWERWAPEAGDPLYTFTIITTEAVPEIRAIHPRMPVILASEAVDPWLDPASDPDDLLAYLRPNGEGIVTHPVSLLVNSPKNDVPECVAPA